MNKNKQVTNDYEVSINYIEPIEDGFIVGWQSNVGFGQLVVHTSNTCNNACAIAVETEYMCNNDNKEFMRQVFEALTEQCDVIE